MAQPREAMTQNLAERLCGQVARRDDSRVARRLALSTYCLLTCSSDRKVENPSR
jgi:hypothetical protein